MIVALETIFLATITSWLTSRAQRRDLNPHLKKKSKYPARNILAPRIAVELSRERKRKREEKRKNGMFAKRNETKRDPRLRFDNAT